MVQLFHGSIVFAQGPTPTSAPAGPVIDIAGWLEVVGNPFRFTEIADISVAISRGVSLVIIVAGLLFLAWFIWGAIEWLTSGGEPEGVKRARERLTHAGIGLGLVVVAWAVFTIVLYIFGIPLWKVDVGPGPSPTRAPTRDCAVACRDAVCPHRYASTCWGDCRCICNPEGNWYLDNPWCDADTHQYVCQGGQRLLDKDGVVSGVDLNCPGD